MKISTLLPKDNPTTLVQARVDASLVRSVRAKLKKKNVRMTEFLEAVMRVYLEES